MVGSSERNLGGESLVDRAGRLVDASKNLFVAYVKLNNHAMSTGASSMFDRKCSIALRMVKEPEAWLLTSARLQAAWSIRELTSGAALMVSRHSNGPQNSFACRAAVLSPGGRVVRGAWETSARYSVCAI